MATVLFQQYISSNERVKSGKKNVDHSVFGNKVGIIAKVFGCWHENISRPFVEGKTGYRSCLKCGARKQFDSETLKTHGAFYYPPIIRQLDVV